MFERIIASLSATVCILDSAKHCSLNVLNFNFGSSAGSSTVGRLGPSQQYWQGFSVRAGILVGGGFLRIFGIFRTRIFGIFLGHLAEKNLQRL